MNLERFRLKIKGIHVPKGRLDLALLVSFVILVGFFLFIDQSTLPDYDAYKAIYQYSALGEHWEMFFIWMNVFFRQIGLSYLGFRNFVLIFSSSALWLVVSRMYSVHPVKSALLRAVNWFLMFFILAVFLFEYFVIRIRAGFAIGLICCAIFCLMSPHIILGRFFAGVFIFLAFFTHQSTMLILTIFLGMPLVPSILKVRPRSKSQLFILLSAVVVTCLLYTINSSFELRGEHIFSTLNPFRFASLSILPLVLFFLIRKNFKITQTGNGALAEFSFYFALFYVVLAVGLGLMFIAGLTVASGEALVRLYTLSSVPALLSFRLSGSVLRAPISVYMLVVNALFFLVTVLLPGGVK